MLFIKNCLNIDLIDFLSFIKNCYLLGPLYILTLDLFWD